MFYWVWDHLDDAGRWLAAVAAGLAAIGWLFIRLRRAARRLGALRRKLEVLADLVERELQPNGGQSTKDYARRSMQHARRAAAEARVAKQRATQAVQLAQENADRLDRVEQAS